MSRDPPLEIIWDGTRKKKDPLHVLRWHDSHVTPRPFYTSAREVRITFLRHKKKKTREMDKIGVFFLFLAGDIWPAALCYLPLTLEEFKERKNACPV